MKDNLISTEDPAGSGLTRPTRRNYGPLVTMMVVLAATAASMLVVARLQERGRLLDRAERDEFVDRQFNTILAGSEWTYRDRLVLGSPSLFTGLPGEGPLTVEELREWLADSQNHEPLDFVLPLGLRGGEDQIQIPEDNPLTRAKIELGRQLFCDDRLSREGKLQSCVDCHPPASSFGDQGVVISGRVTPPNFNRIFSTIQFWDGRAPSLEKQALGPISSPLEMDQNLDELVERLKGIEGYRMQFEAIYGEVSLETLGKALASFERAIVTGPSPYDLWVHWEHWRARDRATLSVEERNEYDDAQRLAARHLLSASARRGAQLFFDEKIGCAACHRGVNFSDEKLHQLETASDDTAQAYKTPTLRNVARKSAYLHDGRFVVLDEVIAWKTTLGSAGDGSTPPLMLSEEEQADLVAFLGSLTSGVPSPPLGRLPE